MPIEIPILLPRLSEAEMRELDYVVMAQAFASQHDLGRLCEEAIYQSDLAARLAGLGIGPIRSEVPVSLTFQGFRKVYQLDLVVADRAIYELKTSRMLIAEDRAQLLNYLLLCNATRGKLLNFRPPSVASWFVNTTLDHAQRHLFEVTIDPRESTPDFFHVLVELIHDWGTGLEAALYRQALTCLLGDENEIERLLPINRQGISLGRQRFHCVSEDSAFFITCFNDATPSYETHLRRMLPLSPLNRFFWANIALHHVSLIVIKP
jgi:GxxExxY protein